MNKKLACMYNEDFIEKKGEWKCEIYEDKGLKEWEKEYEREIERKKWDKEEKRVENGLVLCESRIRELEKCKEEIEERLEVERRCMENMQKNLMEIKKKLKEMGQNKSG